MGRKRKYSDYPDKAIKERRKLFNQDRQQRYREKAQDSIATIIEAYNIEVNEGPVHKCSSCHGLMFKRSMTNLLDLAKIRDKFDSQDYEKIDLDSVVCRVCYNSLKSGKVPKFCHINFLPFTPIPQVISALNPIELRLISPRIAFMQYRSLTGKGQKGIIGSIFNVPMDVNSMVRSLPRKFDDCFIVQLRLKRKLQHPHDYMHGEVRPKLVFRALQYLLKTPLYEKYNIRVDNELFYKCPARIPFNTEFKGEKIQDSDIIPVEEATDQTMVINHDEIICVAPNQYSRTISILSDHDAEELSFPDRFLGNSRMQKKGQTYSTIVRYEIRNADRRHCNPPALFYMTRKAQLIHLYSSVRISMRKCKNNLTARQALNKSEIDNLLSNNECNGIFKGVRNTPFYW